MNRKELLDFLDENFRTLGFKKRSDSWYKENDELIKTINILKSNFGNYYYINYGFIIKSIELKNLTMHIYNRLASVDKLENQRIDDLLDFDNSLISDEIRKIELKKYLENILLNKLTKINTEEDILQELKNKQHLNDIPLIVKKHFNIEE